MQQGKRTLQAARALARDLADRELQVLYDHGEQGADPPDRLGEIVSWMGDEYAQSAHLAYPDIAVVRRDTREAVALIEVEESSAAPKLLLGDLLATLLGDHCSFQGDPIGVGAGTTLIVLALEGSPSKQRQMAELARRVRALQPALRSGNAAIGRIVVETYEKGALQEAVGRLVREARERSDA